MMVMRGLGEERGITLVELLVAAAISSLVASGLGVAAHQLITVTERSRDAQQALHDVQNAGRWLTRDGKRAMSTDLADGAPPVQAMTLSWTADAQEHTSSYYLSGSQLRRDHNGAVITVARNVTEVEFSRSGELVTVSITSTPPGRWEIARPATYYLWVRPAS